LGIIVKKRLVLTIAGLALSTVALAGCASMASPSAGSGSSSGSSSSSKPAATGDDLATGTTTLGTVVVNGKGDTVYMYTNDTANSGMSTCYTTCATVWPAVTTTSATPTIKGVTGTVGTITRTDGTKQVTLNGWPLYTFASDSAAGDVGGQGVMNIWYVLSPAGDKITTAPSSGSSPSPSSSSSSSSGSDAGGGWS
jgi:predicted lipoprotein with Yx(FWY)xxD motif